MSTDAPEDEHAAPGFLPPRRSECAAPGFPPPRRANVPFVDERAAPGFLPPRRKNVPLVLQVSPLDTESSGADKFFFDPFADVQIGNFAAARAFFVHHGHVVVFHECPDPIAFQEMFPSATIGYVLVLQKGLRAEGHKILASQHAFHRASARTSPPPIRPPRSLLDCYVVAGFATLHGGAPSSSTTTISLSSQLGFLPSPSVLRGGGA